MQNLSNTQKFSFLIQNPKNGRELTTNVRRLLAHHFPGVKFSIRQDGGTFHSSCRISYTDGPVKKEVEKIAKLFAYDSSNCDPMTDYYEYANPCGRRYWPTCPDCRKRNLPKMNLFTST